MAIGDGDAIDETELNEKLEDETSGAKANKTVFEVLRLVGETFFEGKELKRIERTVGEAERMAIEAEGGLGNEDEEDDDLCAGDAMDASGPGARSEERTVKMTRMLLQAKQRCKTNEERRMREKEATAMCITRDGGDGNNDTNNKNENNNNTNGQQENTTNAANKGGSYVDSADLKRAAREQIFSSNVAFERLLNEFEDLHRFNGANKFRKYIAVESKNDSVYSWDVTFMNFENGDIARDLALVKKKFGYDYIQVRVELKEDLHPFYPPKITIVRPRLEGIVALASCQHPKFRLKNWQPMTSMTDVLLTARTFLERFARVDVTCPANNKRAYLNGAYDDRASKLDLALCALTCSGETPLIPRAFEDLYERERELEEELRGVQISASSPSATLPPAPMTESVNDKNIVLDKEMEELNAKLLKSRQQDRENKPKLRGFHSGVGYSSASSNTNEKGSRNLWDAKDAKKAQLAQDKMSSDLVDFAKEALVDISHFLAKQQQQQQELQQMETEDYEDDDEELAEECARMIRVFENASLAYFLARELKICDFNNMADRAEYYTSLLECVLVFCETLVPTLKEGVREAFEKYDNMRDILHQAKTFLHVTETANKAVAQDKYKERDQEEIILEKTAKLIVRVGTAIEANAIVDLTKDDEAMTRGSNKRKKVTTPEAREKDLDKAYCSALSRPGFQFDNFALADTSHYKDKLRNQEKKPNTSAIARAVAMISGSLPLSVSSSAFVRVDENQAQLWSFLITGPEDTPYDSGAFIFDAMLTSDFPNKPPLVNLKTTGGGRVRFNPNLYNDGKVCLSLLGTWTGGEGEGWVPETSNMLQVILSIQSLIFVADPCFNEPGWEKDRGTDVGDKKDFEYNAVIKIATLEWAILDHVRRLNRKNNNASTKDGPFDEVLRAHFLNKRDHILTSLKSKWMREAKENKSSEVCAKMHSEKLEAKFTEVAKELMALK